MKVFISYSTENSDLADALSKIINALHPANVEVGIMKNIPFGTQWGPEIEERLDNADILVAIAAGNPRDEFAYPALEVGYFLRSKKQRPKGTNAAERIVIPLFLTKDPPAALSQTQGPNFRNYLLSVGKFDSLETSNEIAKKLAVDENDPAYLLLAALERGAAPTNAINSARKAELINQARNLYGAIIDVVRAQPQSDDQLKSKFIVDLPPNSWDVAQAKIKTEGPLFQRLDLGSPPLDWARIAALLKPEGLGDEWREAVQALLRAVRDNNLEKADQLVSAPEGTETVLVRMFVSRNLLYYSGRRDVHIYIVRLLKEKAYGEAFTTTLWQGIGSCIRLRFLLLEQHDEFSPVVIRTRLRTGPERVREYARELKTELYAAERQWRIAGLDNPVNLVRVMDIKDPKRVTDMVGAWQKQRDALVAATAAVLSSDDDGIESATESWIKTLEEFRCEISGFNATLILRMIDQLRKTVEKAASDDPPARRRIGRGGKKRSSEA